MHGTIPYIHLLYSMYIEKITCYPWLQGESRFIEIALRELPTHTEQEIKAHSAWYTEYCTLLEAKKLAIQQWRKDRQVYNRTVSCSLGNLATEEFEYNFLWFKPRNWYQYSFKV